MQEPRAIGMMISHHEIEHLITSMTDTIRNAAYKVAGERYPEGHRQRSEFFDETGTLIVYDELSVKAILKDALEHYLQFNAGLQNPKGADFNYYLDDSFALIENYIKNSPDTLSYLSAMFAQACGLLASMLAPVIEDLSRSGQSVEKVESFTMNMKESYYLVYGENFDNPETYDPEEDRLDNVDTYQSPEKLKALEKKQSDLKDAEKFSDYLGDVGKLYRPEFTTCYKTLSAGALAERIDEYLERVSKEPHPISSVTAADVTLGNDEHSWQTTIQPLPRHPHIDSDEYHKLTSAYILPELN